MTALEESESTERPKTHFVVIRSNWEGSDTAYYEDYKIHGVRELQSPWAWMSQA